MYQQWLDSVDKNLQRHRPGYRVTDMDQAALSEAFQSSVTPYEFATQATLPLRAPSAPPTPAQLQPAIPGQPVQVVTEQDRTNQTTSTIGCLAAICLGCYWWVWPLVSPPAPNTEPVEQNRVIAKPPPVVDPIRGVKPEASSMFLGMTYEVDLYLRVVLNDYDSLKDVSAGPVVEYGDNAWSQLVDFRAKNRLGAYVKQAYRFIIRDGFVVEAQEVN